MVTFDLPQSCVINKAVPKNAFHPTSRRPAQSPDCPSRQNHLDPFLDPSHDKPLRRRRDGNSNLPHRVASTGQTPALREAMEKVIPYTLLLWLEFEGEVLLSSSQKHPHALESDRSVIDWTFSTGWFPRDDHPFTIQLFDSLDEVAKRLWIQLSGKAYDTSSPVSKVVEDQQAFYRITREIAKLEARISREKQFNKKVELNQKLQSLKSNLAKLS